MGVYLGREAGGERRGESDGIEVGFENDLKSVEAGLQIDRYRDAIVKLRLVPSCCVIFDLEPLSLSLIPRSLNLFLVYLYLCHLAILYLDQHAHTLHHLESLLTISLDNLCLDNLDIFKEDLENQSCRSLCL
ncbi:hypothetical protein Tco_0771019 [Tanacetum coccineum]|uniref:Uncharacterized protein n=1 Tax=Tanacetum coccineum TaxID=301880 RepID=A0ABQ4ZHL7_9ASTR